MARTLHFMRNPGKIFHAISYMQYPLMAVALYFSAKPYFYGFEFLLENYNKVLVFMGLVISFSTLQDTTKTQNKLSLKIYQNPKLARRFLMYIVALILFFLFGGLYGLLVIPDHKIAEVSIGMVVFAIGLIGLLKVAVEMAGHHRKTP